MRKVTRIARAALGAIVLSSSIAVADTCKTVTGTISALQPIPCPNPLGCFKGTFSGDLTGTFHSLLTGLTVVDPDNGTLSFTARTAIETTSTPIGALFTSDVGTGTGCFLLNNQFVCPYSNEVLTVTFGLRAYAQAYGSINLSGGYMAGQPGAYQGQICTHKSK